jgi:hypothetical protein
MFYLYIYLDPNKKGNFKYNDLKFKNEPFYVGKGKNLRKFFHLWESTKEDINGLNKHKIHRIRKIKESGEEVIVKEILVSDNEQYILDKEKEYIIKIGRRDLGTGPLTNLTDGGDGVSGLRHSEDSKEKMSLGNKGKKYPKSDEHRKKLSLAGMGHEVSEETRKKISNTKKEKNKDPIIRKRMSETAKKYSKRGIEHHAVKKYRVVESNGKEHIVDVSLTEFCKQFGKHLRIYLAKSAKTGKPISQGKFKGWYAEIIDENKKDK